MAQSGVVVHLETVEVFKQEFPSTTFPGSTGSFCSAQADAALMYLGLSFQNDRSMSILCVCNCRKLRYSQSRSESQVVVYETWSQGSEPKSCSLGCLQMDRTAWVAAKPEILSIFCLIPICWTFKSLQLFTITHKKEQGQLIINLLEIKSNALGKICQYSGKWAESLKNTKELQILLLVYQITHPKITSECSDGHYYTNSCSKSLVIKFDLSKLLSATPHAVSSGNNPMACGWPSQCYEIHPPHPLWNQGMRSFVQGRKWSVFAFVFPIGPTRMK